MPITRRTAISTAVELARKKKKKKEEEERKEPAPKPAPSPAPAPAPARAPPPAEKEGVFVDPKTGKPSGISIGGRTYLGLSPQDVAIIQQRRGRDPATFPVFGAGAEEEARQRQFQEATGAEELAAELQEKIVEKPSLAPEPLVKEEGVLGEIGRAGMRIEEQTLIGRIAQGLGVGLDPGVAPFKGMVAALAAVGAGAFAAAPYVAATAGSTAVKSVMGAKLLSLKGTIAAALTVAAGGGVIDWRGWEMNTQRKIIGGFVEDGEKLVAIDRAMGAEGHTVIMEILTQAAAEIDEAERVLKEAGNMNIQNRAAKEYLDDMNNIRTARLAVWRRVREIENIAVTGQAALNPEELMYQVERLAEGT